MTRANAYLFRATVTTLFVLSSMQMAVSDRLKHANNDRGEVPGWAIVTAAVCVFGALVYAAVNGVITKNINKIK